MKLVHVGLDLVPTSGGSVASVRDFSQATDRAVISFTHPEKLAREGSAIPGTVHAATSPGFFGKSFAWVPFAQRKEALEAAENGQILVTHLLLRYHVHWVQAVAKRRRVPYWVVPHGCIDPYVFSYRSLVKKVWFRLFGRPFLERAAFVIFATEAERLRAEPYYRGENCRVIHWPVHALDVSRKEEARRSVRERLGIPATGRIVLFLGRLHPLKRPLETIAAFAQAKAQGWHLVLVGPDETLTAAQCRAYAAETGAEAVHVTGPAYGAEKDELMLASDLYISLSEKENFGYTVAEALCAGLPVLLSPGIALCAELAPLGCGVMLQEEGVEQAAHALEALCALDDGVLAQMGARGRDWVLKELSFERFAAKVRHLAEETVGVGRLSTAVKRPAREQREKQ